MKPSPIRKLLAFLVLLGLFGLAGALAIPYWSNRQLSQRMAAMVASGQYAKSPAAAIQTEVAARASDMGLPVRPQDVVVTRTGKAMRIEARYQVLVDLYIYTVKLHLRATSGG